MQSGADATIGGLEQSESHRAGSVRRSIEIAGQSTVRGDHEEAGRMGVLPVGLEAVLEPDRIRDGLGAFL